jgi:TetR/AcrR family transcriptional repressor of nem operon
MRRSRADAARTRERIVDEAGALFRARGIDAVSIADVMGELGLTVGGFYKHFKSKDALVAESIEAAARTTSTKGGSTEEAVRSYLSLAHRAQPAHGCPVAALCSEVGHQPVTTKRAFTHALERLLAQVAALLPEESREQQLHVTAAIVGGLVLARGTNDEKLAQELLRAVSEEVLAQSSKRKSRSTRGAREGKGVQARPPRATRS